MNLRTRQASATRVGPHRSPDASLPCKVVRPRRDARAHSQDAFHHDELAPYQLMHLHHDKVRSRARGLPQAVPRVPLSAVGLSVRRDPRARRTDLSPQAGIESVHGLPYCVTRWAPGLRRPGDVGRDYFLRKDAAVFARSRVRRYGRAMSGEDSSGLRSLRAGLNPGQLGVLPRSRMRPEDPCVRTEATPPAAACARGSRVSHCGR
jgi:hypothetical protein